MANYDEMLRYLRQTQAQIDQYLGSSSPYTHFSRVTGFDGTTWSNLHDSSCADRICLNPAHMDESAHVIDVEAVVVGTRVERLIE